MTHDVLAYLHENDVRFVQVIWCDNANVIRAKMPHVTHLPKSLGVVGISAAQQALPVMFDGTVPDSGLGPVGEVMLRPDWTTVRALPYQPGFASVVSDMYVDGQPWEHCPRALLKEQIERLAEFGLSLKASFENEFFLLERGPNGPTPIDDTIFAATGALATCSEFVLDLADSLLAQGLEVETYYPESGPGQQEMAIRYRDALAAADAQIAFRETARGVAAANGHIVSFLPKIVEDKAGSGCHLNMSLWSGSENVTGNESNSTMLSNESEAFIAGILHHLPALCAVTIPSNISYRRIRPHFWAGAFTAWGFDNREAAVRVYGAGSPPKRFELKTCDATANPYLALAATIAAGVDGLERRLELPADIKGDPGLLSDDDRTALGIMSLPRNLGAAIEAFEGDAVISGALGEARSRAYIAVRRAEWEGLRDLPFEDEVEMLLERY